MDYDLFVIGGGSGGVRSARLAYAKGEKVALAEQYRLGGTCVIRGCIPKKLMAYSASLSRDFKDSFGLGWAKFQKPKFQWQKLRDNIQNELARLENIYENLLDKVTIYKGQATLIDKHSIKINNQIITAQNILIATGGTPQFPDIEGKELVISSNEIFTLEKLPKKLIVYGGSFIAVEFASIFNAYGVEVTLIYRGDKVLRGFDHDLRQRLTQALSTQGIKVILEQSITKITKNNTSKKVHLTSKKTINADQILFATGRTPNTQNLGLENLQIKTTPKGKIITNKYCQTNIANIYALGDVSNSINLTPVAINEAVHFINNLYKDKKTSMDYENIPCAIFTYPPIGIIGLSEQQAREKSEIEIFTSEFTPLKNHLSKNPHKTFMKLIVEKSSQKILGLHILGVDAPEIIQGFAVAMKMGATKKDFDSTLAVHPTAAEEFVIMR